MDNTTDGFEDQVQPERLLVNANSPCDNWLKTCPVARTLEGWSETLDAWVLIAITCNRWSCPICGRKKVQHYARKVADAEPNKLITLTCNPAMHENPRAAYDDTRRKIPGLTARLRRLFGEVEFFRILEITKKGWPHYHLVTRSGFIPQATISNIWKELVGAPIVDVRKIDRKNNAYWYVIKYLAKQRYIAWTDRRAAWTKGFFRKDEFESGEKLFLLRQYFANAHPADHMRWCYDGCTFEKYSDSCWVKVQTAKER